MRQDGGWGKNDPEKRKNVISIIENIFEKKMSKNILKLQKKKNW